MICVKESITFQEDELVNKKTVGHIFADGPQFVHKNRFIFFYFSQSLVLKKLVNLIKNFSPQLFDTFSAKKGMENQ